MKTQTLSKLQAEHEQLAVLREKDGKGIDTDKLVFGMSYGDYCKSKNTDGRYLTRKMCLTVIGFTPYHTSYQGGWNVIGIDIPEPIPYFDQQGVRVFLTSFIGGDSFKGTQSPKEDADGGVTVAFDELPLYVLQNLAMQILLDKVK